MRAGVLPERSNVLAELSKHTRTRVKEDLMCERSLVVVSVTPEGSRILLGKSSMAFVAVTAL